MSKGKLTLAIVAAALVAGMLLPSAALAGTKTIYLNKGVAKARLGMRDSTAAKKIGKVAKRVKDNNYAGQLVYCYYFGKKSSGKYPVEMYSNKKHRVFGFVVNSKAYKTTKSVRVGDSESRLTSKYTLKRYPSSVYTRYHFGRNPGTDFYVKDAKIKFIQIWKS